MKTKLTQFIGTAVVLFGTAFTVNANSGSFCESIEKLGKLYKNKENPYVQEVSFFGRFQAQYAYLDGNDENGNDFNQQFDETRRVRFGAKVKAFHGLEMKANINLVHDRRPQGGNRVWEYNEFYEAKLAYSFGELMGIENVRLSYGRHKIDMGYEGSASSKYFKTMERSAVSNTIFRNPFTSVLISGRRNGVSATFGILSLDKSEFIGTWNAGKAIYFSTDFKALSGKISFDALYNLDYGSIDDEVNIGYEQAYSLSWAGDLSDGWEFYADVILGHKGSDLEAGGAERGGLFWGLVLQPSKFIIEDKLEFVAQYQYQGSARDAGIRANTRYLSRIESKNGAVDIGGRRGDEHHSLYLGLNYFLCGHHSKVMTGVQYETLSTPGGTSNVDAVSFWAAYRFYF